MRDIASVDGAVVEEEPVLGAKKSGLGTMMTGGNPDGERGREKRDFYPSPPEITRALLAVETFSHSIWEPACGDDAIVNVLEAHGHKVLGTDIHPLGKGKRADFFAVTPRKVSNIITNPPFDLAVEFIEHAMKFEPDKVAFVFKSSFWQAAGRQPLFQRHKPARIYPLTWRPDFMGLGRPTMEVMWCVWERGYVGEPPPTFPC